LYSEFVTIIQNTIEKHAPLKNLSRKQRKLQAKPWLAKGILILIRHKRQLYKTHFLQDNAEQKLT